MIGSQLRPHFGRLIAPLVSRLDAWGVTPDAVTLTGTVGVVTAALALFPQGMFLAGTLVITFFVLTDSVDGALARKRGSVSRFGAWLDSTCDRLADGAVFGSLVLWYAGDGNDQVLLAVTLYVLVASLVISYEKARAEGLGLRCEAGIMDRTARLIIVLAAAGLVGLGVPDALLGGTLWVLAALNSVTLYQRYAEVRRQASDAVA